MYCIWTVYGLYIIYMYCILTVYNIYVLYLDCIRSICDVYVLYLDSIWSICDVYRGGQKSPDSKSNLFYYKNFIREKCQARRSIELRSFVDFVQWQWPHNLPFLEFSHYVAYLLVANQPRFHFGKSDPVDDK